jgi:cobalt-zinc-cadmium efflux system membrane fusion protein
MITKRKIILCLLIILALLGGAYAFSKSRHEQAGKAKDEHGHSHEKEGKPHDEAGDEHGHTDEHDHGKEEKKDEHDKESGHGHEHADKHAEEGEHGDSTEITKESAEEAGVKTETAAAGIIRETLTLTGRITLNQNTTAQVKARFPGIVREVKKGPGENVASGEVLATVESNDSLQVYPVKSPINGVILARNTNIGDVAGDTPMFMITNVANVWAEFHIFPRDINHIQIGQNVGITSFEGEYSGEAPVTTLLPIAESSSQTVVARVTLPNPNKIWRAGMTVRGDVVVKERPVALAVKTSSIQRMEGKTVVFVQEGERYSMRSVTLGGSNKTWTEITAGLQAGETYVTEKSFQIKADIGKAGAEHAH